MTMFPMPPARLPENKRAAMRRQLEAKVTRQDRRKPLLITAGAVVVAVATSAGAYAYAQHSAPVTDKGEARCYTVASLSAGPESFTTIAQATRQGSLRSAPVDNALSICADLWRQGILSPGPHGAIISPTPDASGIVKLGPGQGSSHVPQLTACVLADGAAAVFPGPRSTCPSLGLPNATS
jgi:hypothetical protein